MQTGSISCSASSRRPAAGKAQRTIQMLPSVHPCPTSCDVLLNGLGTGSRKSLLARTASRSHGAASGLSHRRRHRGGCGAGGKGGGRSPHQANQRVQAVWHQLPSLLPPLSTPEAVAVPQPDAWPVVTTVTVGWVGEGGLGKGWLRELASVRQNGGGPEPTIQPPSTPSTPVALATAVTREGSWCAGTRGGQARQLATRPSRQWSSQSRERSPCPLLPAAPAQQAHSSSPVAVAEAVACAGEEIKLQLQRRTCKAPLRTLSPSLQPLCTWRHSGQRLPQCYPPTATVTW